jgi:SM-20-related protein
MNADHLIQNTLINSTIDALAQHGYAIVDNFLPLQHVKSLASDIETRIAKQQMAPAGTGQQATRNTTVRGDYTAWLDEASDDAATQAYFAQMEELRQAVNQQLFMNLHSLETHLAYYPIGSVYQKHLDQFSHGAADTIKTRQLSCVLYLNEAWQAQDGGELRLYLQTLNDQNTSKNGAENNTPDYVDILPLAGRLVLFLSGEFWHEVRPAKRARMSLTGWFRTREPRVL